MPPHDFSPKQVFVRCGVSPSRATSRPFCSTRNHLHLQGSGYNGKSPCPSHGDGGTVTASHLVRYTSVSTSNRASNTGQSAGQEGDISRTLGRITNRVRQPSGKQQAPLSATCVVMHAFPLCRHPQPSRTTHLRGMAISSDEHRPQPSSAASQSVVSAALT